MVRIAWVVLLTLVLLSVAGSAFAYRLIVIPTVESLPDSVYKLELAAPFNENAMDEWLPTFRFDGTIYKGLEVSLRGDGAPGDFTRSAGTLLGMNWQIAKETEQTPGYGVGVLNLYDSDEHFFVKESFYAGLFKSVDLGLKFPVKIHVLWGTSQVNGIFGGVMIPMSKRFVGLAEWIPEGTSDNLKSLRTPGSKSGLAWALGYNQSPHWLLKYANSGGDNAYGIVYTSNWLTNAF